MLLYIVRHAYAGQHGDPNYPDDSLRPLTRQGRKRFSRMVKKLARRGFAPEIVATSPLLRCQQTAEVVVERVCPAPGLHEMDALAPGSQLADLIAWSNDQKVDELAWVGHAPDVDQLAGALLGGNGTSLTFGKGAIAAIEFAEEVAAGQGELRWFVCPQILGT